MRFIASIKEKWELGCEKIPVIENLGKKITIIRK